MQYCNIYNNDRDTIKCVKKKFKLKRLIKKKIFLFSND